VLGEVGLEGLLNGLEAWLDRTPDLCHEHPLASGDTTVCRPMGSMVGRPHAGGTVGGGCQPLTVNEARCRIERPSV
jgi:hypothetical protein